MRPAQDLACLLREGICREVEIVGLPPQEHVAHGAADEEKLETVVSEEEGKARCQRLLGVHEGLGCILSRRVHITFYLTRQRGGLRQAAYLPCGRRHCESTIPSRRISYRSAEPANQCDDR